MKKWITLMLTLTLCLSLAACGGKDGQDDGAVGSPSGTPGATQPVEPDTPAEPDVSGDPIPSPSEKPDPTPSADPTEPVETVLELSHTDATLKSAGATFRLRYTATPDSDGIPVFTTDDPAVATVDEDGTVTAVAPGTATITVEYDGVTAKCIVRCRWTETTPSPAPSEKPDEGNVDLQAFYDSMTGQYEFGSLELASSELLDLEHMYAGMTGVDTEQCLVYITMMSMNSGEFGLVQVKDSKDVSTVKAIFQARIDYMAGDDENIGGAFYPFACESWMNNSRVVSNGNYVMMVVHENCDDIVKAFNALF